MAKIATRSHHLRDGSSLIIRNGENTDARALLQLIDITLDDGSGMVAVPGEMSKTVEEEIEWIEKFNANGGDLLLVAEHNGSIVGILDFHSGKRKRLAHRGVFGMAVSPSCRGLGVGSILLSTLIEWAARIAQVEKISLAVRSDNEAAIAMYRKFGFIEEGRRIREIRIADEAYVDDILMYRLVK